MIDEAWAGSSPLARGKPCVRYAGCRCSRAHPRSCGENVRTPCAFSLPYGSSPLTRGKHHVPDCDVMTLGLIPAHAGKTKSPGGCQGCGWAHPHSCGENAKARGYRTMCMGSSPLTRGKPIRVLAVRGDLGLIPAHTGKTGTGCPSSPHPWAHPRSRGENSFHLHSSASRSGSSPLRQGKRCMILPTGRPVRLIPAHARKTRSSRCPARATSAHPRSHGENRNTSAFRPLRTGSSPLTRGKPD